VSSFKTRKYGVFCIDQCKKTCTFSQTGAAGLWGFPIGMIGSIILTGDQALVHHVDQSIGDCGGGMTRTRVLDVSTDADREGHKRISKMSLTSGIFITASVLVNGAANTVTSIVRSGRLIEPRPTSWTTGLVRTAHQTRLHLLYSSLDQRLIDAPFFSRIRIIPTH
jgi:hypothetical protein